MWQDFTKLYSLSKTLRFELVPTEATQTQLKKSGIIDIDQKRHENFKQTKKALDEIHRLFIADSLSGLRLDTKQLREFAELSTNRESKSDKNKQKELERLRKALYSHFEYRFSSTQKSWQEQYGYPKFITSPETQLELITTFKAHIAQKLDLSEQELTRLKHSFDGFAAYFQGFKENRQNIYSTKGNATEIAHRTIDQNLLKFYRNTLKFQQFYANKNTLGEGAASYFALENYTNFITQDEINNYNEAINNFRSTISQARQGLSKQDKKVLPMFEPLFKQILGDGTKKVLFEKLENDQEFNELAARLQQELPAHVAAIESHANTFLHNPSNPDNIWLNARAVNTLIHKSINSPELVKEYLPPEFGSNKKSKDSETAKQSNFVSLQQLLTAIDQAQAAAEQNIIKDEGNGSASSTVWGNFNQDLQEKIQTARQTIVAFSKLETYQNKSDKETLKATLDSFNDLYRMYSYFELRYKNEPVTSLEADPDFYELFEDPDDQDSLFDTDKDKRFSHYYDLIRNYLTKKPYSLDKWKLNFDCSQFLGGWDINQEPIKRGVMIKNKDDFWLAVIDGRSTKVFDRYENKQLFQAGKDSEWRKMDYKLLGQAHTMLIKCLLPKSNRRKYGATDEIIEIYETGAFKKGDNFELTKLHKIIDFFKEAIKRYEGWSMYNFNFSDTSSFESIDQFYHEVTSQGYKLDLIPIDGDILQNMAEEGAIYLFKITNKDLSNPGSKTPNMHTLYFRELFRPETSIKLNGEAKIFFRPETKNLPEPNTGRKTPQGTEVTEFKRFRSDKMQLHVPLTLNYQTKSLVNATFNQHAMERIKTNGVNAVIGIDRGEKHLAYVAVVDKNGKLLEEPTSLNTITSEVPGGSTKTTPYFDLLDTREKERKENRQNWDAVRQIKDLKSGYISHCVKRIVDLMIKHNAVVVLENLNVGFKQGRSAIEKSVYSQLEQALLHKLQYVVGKKEKPDNLFGAQNGVQLTSPDVTPKELKKYSHFGFVFFVDPSYTSAVDPITGYRQQFRLDERINTKTFNNFIKDGFKNIEYKDGHLLFEFSWQKLAQARNKLKNDNRKTEKETEISDKVWTITANVDRLVYDKKANDNHGATIKKHPQTELLDMLQNHGLDLNQNIKQQLLALQPTKKFVGSFVYLFNTINKLRNSDTENDVDAIISPVYQSGFDSTKQKFNGYQWNGDANGAYNIARKGAILLQKLYDAKTPKDFRATVTRAEYDRHIIT